MTLKDWPVFVSTLERFQNLCLTCPGTTRMTEHPVCARAIRLQMRMLTMTSCNLERSIMARRPLSWTATSKSASALLLLATLLLATSSAWSQDSDATQGYKCKLGRCTNQRGDVACTPGTALDDQCVRKLRPVGCIITPYPGYPPTQVNRTNKCGCGDTACLDKKHVDRFSTDRSLRCAEGTSSASRKSCVGSPISCTSLGSSYKENAPGSCGKSCRCLTKAEAAQLD